MKELTVIKNQERKKDCNPLLFHGPLNDGVAVKRVSEPALEDEVARRGRESESEKNQRKSEKNQKKITHETVTQKKLEHTVKANAPARKRKRNQMVRVVKEELMD